MKLKSNSDNSDPSFENTFAVSKTKFSLPIDFEQTDFLQPILVSKEYFYNKKIVLLRFPQELSLSSIDALIFDSNKIKEIKIKGSDNIYSSYNETIMDNSFGLIFSSNGSNIYEIHQNFHFADQTTVTVMERIPKIPLIASNTPSLKRNFRSLKTQFKSKEFDGNFGDIGISELKMHSKNTEFSHADDIHLRSVVVEKHMYGDYKNNRKKMKVKKNNM
ncbi:hypothetical protein T552_01144 [Pneumocystis carinii B80]|uniref:Uncharacterized protein n=1 Tax=Pneumocystis carinii (strain B80) TaxID=1408658 RepID=A0A0W4ZLF0_PNEC8|nr:hypothetical protein T552_01144 [Pneumocystis carinii B80]KTW29187.1 hypothetical protein T552_01144 [Pneumocystis carinii B80]